jgi:hypothetical protein
MSEQRDAHSHQTTTGAVVAAMTDIPIRGQDLSISPDPTVHSKATQGAVAHNEQNGIHGIGTGPQVMSTKELEVICGPLLEL